MSAGNLISGLAPFILAAVLMGAALVGGKLPAPLRRRLAVWGLGVIGLAIAGFGAVLVVRGLAEGSPPVWARGASMVLLIVACVAMLLVRARSKASTHRVEGAGR